VTSHDHQPARDHPGFKDFCQARHHFVANTRWWPPFCAFVDFVVALALVAQIAAGVDLHT
jgi:hypothetical protein